MERVKAIELFRRAIYDLEEIKTAHPEEISEEEFKAYCQGSMNVDPEEILKTLRDSGGFRTLNRVLFGLKKGDTHGS
jgi:hypothetical protein